MGDHFSAAGDPPSREERALRKHTWVDSEKDNRIQELEAELQLKNDHIIDMAKQLGQQQTELAALTAERERAREALESLGNGFDKVIAGLKGTNIESLSAGFVLWRQVVSESLLSSTPADSGLVVVRRTALQQAVKHFDEPYLSERFGDWWEEIKQAAL